ncbi:nitronate monooxygenase [Prescottella defluvii]|nr:nitronate monooxygenase [Prescottella defluvii]
MFLVSGPDLVVAACRSGIVGSFPTQNCRTVDDLDTWMGTITDSLRGNDTGNPTGPWAANLVTHSSNARLADDLRLIAEYKPQIVITALGSPRPVMDVVKGYGGTVIADVVNMKLAKKAAEAGADGMACVSAGAGGHTGHLSPFAFTSAVREFFDGMVIIGGGISDGYGSRVRSPREPTWCTWAPDSLPPRKARPKPPTSRWSSTTDRRPRRQSRDHRNPGVVAQAEPARLRPGPDNLEPPPARRTTPPGPPRSRGGRTSGPPARDCRPSAQSNR